MTVLLAGCCVFAAVFVLSLPPPAVLRLRAVRSSEPSRAAGAEGAARTREGVPAPGGTGADGGVGALRGGRSLGAGEATTVSRPAPAPAYIVDPVRWARRARRTLGGAAKEAAGRRASVVELCDGIAAELAAGRPPDAALVSAVGVLPTRSGLAAVADAARAGEDVAAALQRASAISGYEGLRLLAGCWRIGVERGGMLAAVIEGLAEALRDEQAHHDEIALHLAGPRATARLLAGLPLLGLLMAMALGAHPFGFLFGTLPGAACLCLGVGLDALGLWWTRRLAIAAEVAR